VLEREGERGWEPKTSNPRDPRGLRTWDCFGVLPGTSGGYRPDPDRPSRRPRGLRPEPPSVRDLPDPVWRRLWFGRPRNSAAAYLGPADPAAPGSPANEAAAKLAGLRSNFQACRDAYAEWQSGLRDSELKFAVTTHQIIRAPAAAVSFAQALEVCLTVGRRDRCDAGTSDYASRCASTQECGPHPLECSDHQYAIVHPISAA